MQALAHAPETDLADKLGPLAEGYEKWLDEQAAQIPDLPAPLRETAEAAIFTARQCAQRIPAGIALVSSPDAIGHEQAIKAFRFANEAMALQRQHTTIAALRETRGYSYPQARADVEARSREVASCPSGSTPALNALASSFTLPSRTPRAP